MKPAADGRAARPAWTEEERREFLDEITAINLQRCQFAMIAGSMIVVWSSVVSLLLPEVRFADLGGWLATCLGIYAAMFLLRRRVMREGVSQAARRAYVFAFMIVLIGICDGFFLLLSQQVASVSSFSRGMLVTGVLFIVPPRRFIPIAAVNELLLCGWLAWRGLNAATFTAFLDGTAGAVVASMGSWLLHAAKCAEFRQQRQIRRQHADMNELMAVTAHDLRSPLLGVKNLLTLATTRVELDRTRLVAVITDAARACDRMLKLVSELVHAHAAEQAPETRGVQGDLRGPLAAAVERARPVAETKGLRIEARVGEGAAEASFDEAALAQVLDNLLGNALKFSPRGATIEAALAGHDGTWRVEIADEGPGVPEAERARLFQKYARGSVAANDGEGSTGLGLFIAKTLAERMGARMHYAPREPRGSVFAVELPRA